MQDKNGKEIKTGMVVGIRGAYFKNDNGLYFVTNSPGDPTWIGNDYCLMKIGKSGKISKTKHSICFWPLVSFVNNREKNAQAKEWNEKHAEIEIVPLMNMNEVKAFFQRCADEFEQPIEFTVMNYGEDSERVLKMKENRAFYEAVAASI